MKYHKEYTLKDGRTCIVRNGTEEDAAGVLNNFNVTHGQTEFLTTYEDELTFTLDQERSYLKQKAESGREIELVAEVDGAIAGTAGVSLSRSAADNPAKSPARSLSASSCGTTSTAPYRPFTSSA